MCMNSKVNEEKVKSLNFQVKELQFDIHLREVSSQEDHSLLHLMVSKKSYDPQFYLSPDKTISFHTINFKIEQCKGISEEPT